MLNKLGYSLAVIFVSTQLSAQVFLNGDFEINTAAPCDYNMINASFTAKMSNATAYGVGNELDIMQSTCPYGPSQNGTWFVGLAFPTGSDAFTMMLSSPLVSGNTYTMKFYDKGDVVCCSPGAPVVIGVSTVAGAAGTPVYTGPTPTGGVWTLRCFSFVAPNSGQHISVSITGTRWTHVDNFSMGACPLPIELIDFTSACQNKGTLLSWSTATEKNNDHFSIERSLNGVDYTEIGTVKGAGNSYKKADYSFFDQRVAESPVYYRLVQIDNDKTAYPSAVISTETCSHKEFSYELFPNPVSDQLFLNVRNADKTPVVIRTPLGQTVYEGVLNSGRNSIDLGDLQSGVYTLQITTPEKVSIEKLIKQ